MRRMGRLRYLDVPPAGALRPAGRLVFIHGFPLSPSMWDPQFSLADTRSQGDSPEAVVGRRNMQQVVREKGTDAVADALLPKLVGDTTRRERPDVVEAIRSQITGNSVEGIVGDEDAITPPPLSEQMHRDIPGSELTMIKGAGHMSNMEQPALFTDTLVRFLEHRV